MHTYIICYNLRRCQAQQRVDGKDHFRLVTWVLQMVGKSLAKQQQPVMWSETVGLRTRPVWDPKKSFLVLHTAVLVLQVWCCVVKHGLVMLVVIMILKVTATFQVLFILSLFCAWTSLLWRSTVAFTYLKVKSAKRLCLLPVVLVLVLLFWSWS